MLIGAVVLRVTFLEVGRKEGTTVNIRFKITPKGSTGWVKWIIGARALDCKERGGLGFTPGADSYYWSALGIHTERVEQRGKPKLQKDVYAVKGSVVDDEAVVHDWHEENSKASTRP